MALSLSPSEVEEDLLRVGAADAGEPRAGHEPVRAQRPRVGDVQERHRGDGQVLQQGRSVGRRRVRLGRRPEHERLSSRPPVRGQLLGEAALRPEPEQRGQHVARHDGAAERRRARTARACRPRTALITAAATCSAGTAFGPPSVVGVSTRVAEVGGDGSGLHHRHPDAVRLELHDQRLGEPDAGELGRRVDRLERGAEPPGDRSERDDVARVVVRSSPGRPAGWRGRCRAR